MKTKSKVASILFFYLTVILVVIMVIHSLIDYQNYLQHPEFSAPFATYMIVNSVIYGIPIIICWGLSYILNNKSNRLFN
jgi:heme/copper-type cytochrome/quinol oxidase subunit 2